MNSGFLRLFAVSLTVSIAAAQEPAASQDATIQALLKEVHALRVALERSNQIGPKVQIALARMQFEEERVRNANHELLETRERVTDVQNKVGEIGSQIKLAETRQAQTADVTERKQADMEIAALKASLEQFGALQQQLQAKEAEANSLLVSEQARWNEANNLLTAIERAMTPVQP